MSEIRIIMRARTPLECGSGLGERERELGVELRMEIGVLDVRAGPGRTTGLVGRTTRHVPGA